MNTPPYNLGFQSQEKECVLRNLEVQGAMPDWLEGTLLRVAPSKFEVGPDAYRHWFDGLSMLHRFAFGKDGVHYSSKFLQSNTYRINTARGRIVLGEFGTDPCRDLFRKVQTFFAGPKSTDNGGVNVNLYGDTIGACTETPYPTAVDPDTLETLGGISYDDELGGHVTTPHPHYEPDGRLYSFTTAFGPKTHYLLYTQAPGSLKRELVAKIPVEQPAYMHSLGMTENYLLLTEFPLVTNPLHFRFTQKPFIEKHHWDAERGVTIHVVHKQTGEVRTFDMEVCFSFHHANAFETESGITFDMLVYPDASVVQSLYLDQLRAGSAGLVAGHLWRCTIDFQSGAVQKKLVTEQRLELPQTNYSRINGRPYQYLYAAGNHQEGNFLDSLVKVAVNTGETTVWAEEGCYPGEAVFVERPGAQSEDDGVLLSVVLDTPARSSFLLVLQADTMKELARVPVPHHITFGFHGRFLHQGMPEEITDRP